MTRRTLIKKTRRHRKKIKKSYRKKYNKRKTYRKRVMKGGLGVDPPSFLPILIQINTMDVGKTIDIPIKYYIEDVLLVSNTADAEYLIFKDFMSSQVDRTSKEAPVEDLNTMHSLTIGRTFRLYLHPVNAQQAEYGQYTGINLTLSAKDEPEHAKAQAQEERAARARENSYSDSDSGYDSDDGLTLPIKYVFIKAPAPAPAPAP
jgi:hypothetical protein